MLNEYETAKRIVERRCTQKVISSVAEPILYGSDVLAKWDALVLDAIAAAGMAPFHFERGVASIPEPWRVHFLDQFSCRQLAQQVGTWFEIKSNNKIPGMLSACGCLVLISWLPQFRSGDLGSRPEPDADASQANPSALSSTKQIEVDDEHLAATAALVQNLLILLTAAGLGTYWSSGGFLGSATVFERLEIDTQEKLLAAVFVEYPEGQGTVTERIAGKNRPLRRPAIDWLSRVSFRK